MTKELSLKDFVKTFAHSAGSYAITRPGFVRVTVDSLNRPLAFA